MAGVGDTMVVVVMDHSVVEGGGVVGVVAENGTRNPPTRVAARKGGRGLPRQRSSSTESQ
jgi:hypothetical protein